MSKSIFLEPLDVLLLRGNKLFGDPGSFGESLVPPWPSVVAGALRSRILADDGVDLAAFSRGEIIHPALGSPTAPGSFAITAFHLARRTEQGVEMLVAPPADLVLTEDDPGKVAVQAICPIPPIPGLCSSSPLGHVPVLPQGQRSKPVSGYWLLERGWKTYLAGKIPDPSDFVPSAALWQWDHRVGVGLDTDTRCVADGRLFSMQAVAMVHRGMYMARGQQGQQIDMVGDYDVGFLVSVTGMDALPSTGLVRLGGDGRAAAVHQISWQMPEPDYERLAKTGRCRMVLTTPGIFPDGWLPCGCTQQKNGDFHFALGGVQGRLVCAAVSRYETVSGWDLANWQPKAAQRAVPAGSVYWFEDVQATAQGLQELVRMGLWSQACEDVLRRAEGFNRIILASY